MRIGVVGDTHNMMTNVDQIVELFREARVERVVHTGDITQANVLDRFAALEIPLLGVFGNNDAGTRDSLTARAEPYSDRGIIQQAASGEIIQQPCAAHRAASARRP